MNELKTYEEFEAYLKRRAVPEFDESLTINRIQAAKGKWNVKRKIKIIVLLAALLLIVISSAAYGKDIIRYFIKTHRVITSTNIRNDDGKVLYEYQKIEYSDDEIGEREKLITILKEYSGIMSIHKYKLRDNEAELFIVTDAYKIDGSMSLLCKDKRFNLLEDVIENSTIKFKKPKVLPDQYHFKYGLVTNDKIKNNKLIGEVADRLYNKAIDERKDYITQKFKLSPETTGIKLDYAEGGGHNDIEITINGMYRQFGGDSIQIELIDINGLEAVYKKYENSTLREITFVDYNGTDNLTYTVRYQSPTYLYEDLYPHIIKMIESMFEQ